MGRWLGTAGRTSGVALATGALVLAGAGLAGAASGPGVVKEPGLAGYHFAVSKSATSLTAKGTITLPNLNCAAGSSNVFAPQIVVNYLVGTSEETAEVSLGLTCASGIAVYGQPSVEVGSKNETAPQRLGAGEQVTVTIAISASKSSATVTAGKQTATLTNGGGRPAQAQYSVVLPDPPKYSPVKFSQCTVDGKDLSTVKPGGWEGVSKSGQVIGKISAISGGTSFTVSY
jgi:hypothetical protein